MKKTAMIAAVLLIAVSCFGCASILPEARVELVQGGTVSAADASVSVSPVQAQPSAAPAQPSAAASVPDSDPAAAVSESVFVPMDPSFAGADTWDTAYILQTLTNAVNAAKAQTGSVQLTLTRSHSLSMDSCSPEPVREMAQEIFDRFRVEREDTYPIVDGTVQLGDTAMTVNDILTPAGNTFSVPEDAVASAKASFDGANVIIRLTMKEDHVTETEQIPMRLAGCLDFMRLRKEVLSSWTVSKLDASYTGTSVTAGLDPQGRLVLLTVTSDLSGTAAGGVGVLTADVSFSGAVSDKWNLTYPDQPVNQSAENGVAAP